jgi:isopentenyl-diphosphate delta-isomerase
VHLVDVRLVLPTFRYRAEMPDGVVENEMCPVFTAVTASPVRAAPAEVDDFAWVDWADFRRSVLDGGRAVSPWCVEQVRLLPSDPLAEPPAVGVLPHAAR